MSLFKKLFAVASTVAMLAAGLTPMAAQAAAHGPGTVFKSAGDATVWFITSDNTRRAFTSGGAFLSYGFLNWGQVVIGNSDDFALTSGSFIPPRDGGIFCATVTKDSDVAGECALITGGMKAAFTSAAVFAAQGHTFARAQYGDSSFLSKTSNIDNGSAAHRPGVLVNENGTIYLVGSSSLLGIPSVEVFNSWGYSFADAVTANAADMSMTKSGVMVARVAGQLNPSFTSNPTPPVSGFNPNGGTQGSIDTLTVGSRNKTEALAGQTNVEINANDFKLTNDGPLMLQSVDVWFAEADAGTESQKPWDYFTKVSLMVGGTSVASMNTTTSADWSTVTDGNITGAATTKEYRLRFTGLNSVLANNATTKVSVAVSMVSNLDSADITADWSTELGDFRILDESGLTQNKSAPTVNGSATALEQVFTVGNSDIASLEFRDATDPIDAQVVQVSKTSDTNNVAIYNFTIKEKNGVAVDIDDMQLTFATTTGPAAGTLGDNENDVIRTARIFEGATQRGSDETVPIGGVTLFDNTGIHLNANQTKTFTVKVNLFDTNDAARYDEGTTLSVSVTNTGTVFTALDANGNDETDITLSFSAVSNTHELRSNGINVALVGTPTATVTTNTGPINDSVEFQWVIDVTAFGDSDVYINKDAADVVTADDAADVDTLYSKELSGGTAVTTNGTIVVGDANPVDVTADATAYSTGYATETFFVVPTGATRRFTITVSGTNATDSKQIRALLNNIEWTVDDVTCPTACDGSTATINAYTVGLGSEAATPFRFID